ncbi:MAG: hypothetical protein E7Z92_06685 [Cyanobacteria bacterium SIG31]|nr:hypothetical protein [Cyanobacteria bacterium SIG31]
MRDYEFYYTQDGSIGLYSYADDDVYHSKYGALTEAWEKFVLPSGITNKLNNSNNIRVLDVCYGIGYNTKALMSFVINKNEKLLKEKNFFEKIKNKIKKNETENEYTDTTDVNNNLHSKNEILSTPIESNNNILSYITIDCLDINKELIKISPLLKTVITPQEIFSRIIPRIFDCFDLYWAIKRRLAKLTFKIAPKNKKNITEMLDLKFNNDYDEIENEYRVHKFVNYILVDELINKYKDNYLNEDIKKIIKTKGKKQFFDNSLVRYANFKQNSRYKIISKMNLNAYLHNIYYDHLSNRYKRARFKDAAKLFKVNFYANDARKTVLELQGQYDYIFLDAFTYSKAPELWTVEFMAELYNRLSPRGVLMTYSNSALVRNTLLENNFYVGKIYNKKTNKYIGTIAAKDKSMIEYSLTNYEIGLCNTRAGIPYHDQTLNLTKEQILKNREYEFKNSDLMTSSQYMRARSTKNGESDE